MVANVTYLQVDIDGCSLPPLPKEEVARRERARRKDEDAYLRIRREYRCQPPRVDGCADLLAQLQRGQLHGTGELMVPRSPSVTVRCGALRNGQRCRKSLGRYAWQIVPVGEANESEQHLWPADFRRPPQDLADQYDLPEFAAFPWIEKNKFSIRADNSHLTYRWVCLCGATLEMRSDRVRQLDTEMTVYPK